MYCWERWARRASSRSSGSGFHLSRQGPYGAPVLFVPRNNGTWWTCINYHALNGQTVKDRYPLSIVDLLLYRLGQAQVFTKLHQGCLPPLRDTGVLRIWHGSLIYHLSALRFGSSGTRTSRSVGQLAPERRRNRRRCPPEAPLTVVDRRPCPT